MPASLEACRECNEDVSEFTGEDKVVGDDEVDDVEAEEQEEGDTEGNALALSVLGFAVISEKDLSAVGDKFVISVTADDIDIESIVVAVVLAAVFVDISSVGSEDFVSVPQGKFPSGLLKKLREEVLALTSQYL